MASALPKLMSNFCSSQVPLSLKWSNLFTPSFLFFVSTWKKQRRVWSRQSQDYAHLIILCLSLLSPGQLNSPVAVFVLIVIFSGNLASFHVFFFCSMLFNSGF
ncbi:hypothetical protein SLEP1_g37197 [Rubroshorea leprosula]|uniref:Uncharacterized protein n=1 Tax=Rubroshorea leprosula TaxID=152421 RepID=A0AAV5KUA4_9ROSI|nr:hypothetical protein SLEP1_g37197 [Rubroshorea leprosula]